MAQVGQQRFLPLSVVNRSADVAVEIAVGALGEAERPMDIERAGHCPTLIAKLLGDQPRESIGAVADQVFLVRIMLGKGPRFAQRNKHRVIAKTQGSARGPG